MYLAKFDSILAGFVRIEPPSGFVQICRWVSEKTIFDDDTQICNKDPLTFIQGFLRFDRLGTFEEEDVSAVLTETRKDIPSIS